MSEHGKYLDKLIADGHLDRPASLRAEQLIDLLRMPPRLAPGPDGMVGATWENARCHLNIEVHSDGYIEFFYEDLITGETFGS